MLKELGADTRTCTACKETKPVEEFNRSGFTRAGLPKYKSQCKPCHRERDRVLRPYRESAGSTRQFLNADGEPAYRENALEKIPSGPFRVWLEGQVAAGNGLVYLGLCALPRPVSERSLFRVLHERQELVSLALADGVCLGQGVYLRDIGYDD